MIWSVSYPVFGQTWTGATSSDWNTASNWSTGVVPTATGLVVINNAAAPNQPILDANRTIRDLTVSNGVMDLNGFQLTVSRNAVMTGGSISNGTLSIFNYTALENTIFNGTITLIKTSSNADLTNGGNVFNGPTTIRNNDNNTWRLANLNGDTFNSTVTFIKGNSGNLEIGYNGSTVYNGQITINNLNAGGTLSIGGGGGTNTLNSGGIVTSSFATGTLDIRNFTQVTNTPNGVFSPANLTISNSTLLGDFTATVATNFNVLGNTFFCTGTGSLCTLTKNGGGTSNWTGGNTFGTVIITNNSNSILRLANSGGGDTFISSAVFNNSGTNFIDIAYTGTNTFAQQITLNNTNAGGDVRFGEGGGVSTLTTGGVITTDFAQGALLEFNNFTQIQNVPNGSFTVSDFFVNNSTFQGDFSVTTTDDTDIETNNTFNGTNTFISAGDLNLDGPNTFSTPAGTSTTFIKNGGPDDTWLGGNTFGTVSVINNSNALIRLAGTNGDTFLGTSEFTNTGTNFIDIAYNGTNTFAESITINNTNAAGDIRFGGAAGTSSLTTGSLTTSNFSVGALLDIDNFTQVQNVANGNFGVAIFNSTNSSFQGDFQVTGTTSVNFIGSNTFARNATFTAPSLTANAGNSFATLGGAANFTKTGNTANTWTGGNTFGQVVFNNNSNGSLRLANTTGDTFTSTSTFENTGTSFIDISYNGTNSFAESITINNTNPAGIIGFGRAAGTSNLATGGLLTTNFSVGNTLDIHFFTQVQNITNGIFGVATFNSTNSSFQGDFEVTATTSVNFIGPNTFARNATFTAPSLTANAGNSFATLGGVANFTKTGNTANTWIGGNTFGIANFTHNAGGTWRLAGTNGDIFEENVSFVRTGTGALEPAYNGTSTFSGNISTTGTTSAISFGLGSGVVSIQGNTIQQLQGNATFSPIIRRLSMNTSGTLELAVPLSISLTATFSNGIIQSSSTNLLTIENTSTASGMSDSSHTDGPTRKIGNQAFTFPTGDAGYYAPISIAARGGGGLDEYIAQYFQIAPVDIPTDTVSKDPTIGLMNQSEHWVLDRIVGTLARGVTLSYNSSRTSPIIDYTELVSIRYDGSAWRDIGGFVSGTAASGTVTAGTTTTGEPLYSIASSFRILPVELLSFQAKITDSQEILIEWVTASEKDNSHFILEKSADGILWETLALVPGSGDSQERINYQFLDTNPRLGRQFYRLIQVDFDGDSDISQTIGISLLPENSNTLAVRVFPNPTKGKITLESQTVNLDEMTAVILDLTGKVMVESSSMKNTRGTFDLSHLPKGMYLLKLYSTKEVITKKIILE